jgi:hypothetical protein
VNKSGTEISKSAIEEFSFFMASLITPSQTLSVNKNYVPLLENLQAKIG